MYTCYLAEDTSVNQGNDGMTKTPEEGTCLERLMDPAAATACYYYYYYY
jgi:hypothetical protein